MYVSPVETSFPCTALLIVCNFMALLISDEFALALAFSVAAASLAYALSHSCMSLKTLSRGQTARLITLLMHYL